MAYSKVLEINEAQDKVDLSIDDLDALIVVQERPSELKLGFPKLNGDNRARSGNVISISNRSGKDIVTDVPDTEHPGIYLKISGPMDCRFILTRTVPNPCWYIVGGI